MEYEEMLDFESRKLLRIFNLLSANNESSSLEELSVKLGINSKTIARTLKKIKNLIDHYQLDEHLEICCRLKNQFYLKRTNDLYVAIFLVRYLNDVPEIIFLKAVIEEKTIQTKQLAKRLLISESSMRRRVKKINEVLKKMAIRLKWGTYELVGEEEQIRALILHFYWFAYQGMENDFLMEEKVRSQRLTNQLTHFFQMKINDLQKESLFRIVQIAAWRSRNGRKVWIKKEWKQYIENSVIFTRFIAVMKGENKVDSWDFDELTYLYLIVQANFLPYFDPSVQTFIIQEHYSKKTTSYRKTHLATQKFKQVFWDKEFNQSNASMLSFLSFHLYYELISDFPFGRNPTIVDLEKKYPCFMRKIEEGIGELTEAHTSYQKIPKEALYSRYFIILSSLISPLYNEKRVLICLMTDLSLEKEKELGKRIINFFEYKFNLMVIYARTSGSISCADIILTTVIYQALEQQHAQRVLFIDPIFSEEVFFKIENLIKKVRK
ncbi:helix-turn-helix domain-containing protein [Enterococcus crotali]